MLVRV